MEVGEAGGGRRRWVYESWVEVGELGGGRRAGWR